MNTKSLMKQSMIRNLFININTIILIYVISIFLITTCKTKQITIFEANNQVEFAKFSDYTIKFSEMEDLKLADFFYEHSFISVIANVTIATDCNKKSSVFYIFNQLIAL